jgi:hypothetical protein
MGIRFTLSRPGSLAKNATLYELGKTKTYYDALRGLVPADFIEVAEKEPEVLEDGSLAPWTSLLVRIHYRDSLPPEEREVHAEMLVPKKAIFGEFGNRISGFRWKAP